MSVSEPGPSTTIKRSDDSEPSRRGSVAARRRIIASGAALAVLVVAIVAGVWLKAGEPYAVAARKDSQTDRTVNVILDPVQRVHFERALNVQGNVEAKRVAAVSPRIAGALEAIFVDKGERVVTGETRLFQADPVRLAKTVEVRRHEVDVAEHSLREKQASLEKNQADYDKAEYDWNRQREMFEKGVSSNIELEDAHTEYRVCAALMKHAEAIVDLADAQLKQARSARGIAQKDLDDSLVIAPINGHVTERFHEPGEMGSPGQPVLRIEDLSLVEVSVFLPAQAYGEVTPGETAMHVTINCVNLGQHVVSYKSPTIDSQLRTFEVRCLLHDPSAGVAPGPLAHVRVVLEYREGWGVPRDAIQNRAGGTVIFVAEDDKARMIPVTVGLEMNGMVEVVSEQLSETSRIVVVGGYFLNPDATIKVVQGKS